MIGLGFLSDMQLSCGMRSLVTVGSIEMQTGTGGETTIGSIQFVRQVMNVELGVSVKCNRIL